MKLLAVIPARGGSKRLPGKNVRLLGGVPLLTWSIRSASGLAEVCDILVSTDDAGIGGVAEKAGALVPWLRPPALATDTATSVDVCLHALDWYEQVNGPVDGLLLLQPTSPFRSRETVRRGIELFRRTDGRPVIGIAPALSHPRSCFRVENGTLTPVMKRDGVPIRSQDLEPVFVVSGALYLVSPAHLRGRRAFVSGDAVPLIIDSPVERIDIDTAWDWTLAEHALATGIVR